MPSMDLLCSWGVAARRSTIVRPAPACPAHLAGGRASVGATGTAARRRVGKLRGKVHGPRVTLSLGPIRQTGQEGQALLEFLNVDELVCGMCLSDVAETTDDGGRS